MVNELSRGISQVQFMNDLCTAFQADHEVVDSKLAHLFASLMCSVEKPKVLIVGEEVCTTPKRRALFLLLPRCVD